MNRDRKPNGEITDEYPEKFDSHECMYQETKSPEETTIRTSEASSLERAGWLDTPREFAKGFRSKARLVVEAHKKFWLKHWQWVIGTIIAIAAVIVSYLKG